MFVWGWETGERQVFAEPFPSFMPNSKRDVVSNYINNRTKILCILVTIMSNVRRRQNMFNPPHLYAPLSKVGQSHFIDMSLCSHTFSLMSDILTLCYTATWHLYFCRSHSALLVWCGLPNIEELYWWPLFDGFVFVAYVIEFDCL